jgi:feruloyl esterase
MLMAQRYPLYFDGIVAGAPAMRTGHSNLETRSYGRLESDCAEGSGWTAYTGGALSDGDRRAIIAKLLDVCDARDGVKAE